MMVTSSVKNVRLSPEKVRLVVGQIRKLSPSDAISQLDFVKKSSAPVLKKVIKSAIANGKNNFGLDESTLRIKEITVNKGPVAKRYQPQARGRANQVLKRTSHINVVLEGEKSKPKVSVSNVSKEEGGQSGPKS